MVGRFFAKAYLWILLILLYSPIVIIMIYSFTEAKVLGNWTGFSTKLYSSLFTSGSHHSLTNALINTLTIALIAATVSTLLGSITAIGVFNLKARAKKTIGFVNSIPILNGDIITGISLFLLFVSLGISQGYTTVVLAHITFCTPYVVLSVMPRLKQMNPNIYEAALDLGATPMQALRKVIFPEIRPGMISGFMLALTLSIDDFAVTVFTIGNEGLETLSTYIYADARKGGLTPELRPLSTIIFVVVLALLILINKRTPQSGAKTVARPSRRKTSLRGAGMALLLLASSIGFTGCYNKSEPRTQVLKVYNWADYIDEEVLEEFPAWYKEQTGENLRVVYQTFDINEIMLTKIEKGHEDFDVVCPSEYIIERMLRKNLLLPIDTVFGQTPNYLHNISPYIREQLAKLSQPGRPANEYAVGYMWGTAGILYNKAFVPDADAETWGCLWNEKYKGKILMKESYRDAYGTAIIYAHAKELSEGKVTVEELMNNYTPEAMALVEEYLKAMKPLIAGWEADFGKEMMTKNKAWINMTWSGDAVWAIEEAEAVGVDLDYTVPKEGSNVWYDGWVIPKYAKNVKAASYFINYLCRPEVALRNMDACGYVSAVATPEILEEKIDTTLTYYLDLSYFFGSGADSIQIDKVQYPDRKVVERCAMIRDFGDKTEDVMEIWSRIKGDNLGVGVTIVIFVVVGVMSGYTIYKKIQRYKRTRQSRRRHRRRR